MRFGFGLDKSSMISPDDALPGRPAPGFAVPSSHAVLGTPLSPPWPDGHQSLVLGMGCFWGVERIMWQLDGIHTTAVGYSGGFTPHPTYEEVCSGRTGHNEVVLVVFPDTAAHLDQVLTAFWEGHDPTQGMRQGNDRGTQYRSGLYVTAEQAPAVEASRDRFGAALADAGRGEITTEIAQVGAFYYAEDYHQQYLHKVPNGYCGLGGTGVVCPSGIL